MKDKEINTLKEMESIGEEINRDVTLKTRKISNVKNVSLSSLLERINEIDRLCASVAKHLFLLNENDPSFFKSPYPEEFNIKKGTLDLMINSYDSVSADLRKTVSMNAEQFEKLFPKIIRNFKTPKDIYYTLLIMQVYLESMRKITV